MKATKEAPKKQPTVGEKPKKALNTVELLIKSTLKGSIKVLIVTQPITVVVKEEGSKMTTTAGRRIKLPQRYKS